MSAHWRPLPQSLQCAGATSTSAATGDADDDGAAVNGPGTDDVVTAPEAGGADDGAVASQPAIRAIVTRAARPPFTRRRRLIRSGGYPSDLSCIHDPTAGCPGRARVGNRRCRRGDGRR